MIKTGFSRKCINSPIGTPIIGYFEKRYTKGILDDIYVSTVAFDDGERQALIIAADLLEFSNEKCDTLRRLVSAHTKVPFDSVLITCSHTHTGPIYGFDNITKQAGAKEYDGFLESQMCLSAEEALKDVCESVFSTASSQADMVSFIRRFRMADGSVMTNPGINRDDIDCALGKSNDTVKLVKIERPDANDIFLVSFGVHPDTVGGEFISADFPGFVRSTLEGALPDTKCVFLNGAEGDVNHINPYPSEAEQRGMFIDFDGVPRGYKHAKHMGRKIAGAVLGVCTNAEEVASERISPCSITVTVAANSENSRIDEARRICEIHNSGRDELLPYKDMELTTVVAEATRIVSLYDGPESFDFTLCALKIGDIVFAGLPGEPFVEIGRRIEAASPFKFTVVCALANGGDTYFPTSSAYDEGGYEARTSFLKKGADDILVNGFADMFKSLYNK